jgi:HD-GYP domain-containing protein (c-di-GMP phosphodiesterase class II)
MQLTALSVVRHRIKVGSPLPFNVRNADHTLLLACGKLIESSAQLDALFERGALVDLAELQTARERLEQVPREELPQRWSICMNRVSQTLQQAPQETFSAALDEASAPVIALIERDPDLAIFQVLRQQGGDHTAYGVRRSLNCAITAFLVAHRLGWDGSWIELAFKVALTMNLSMLELQGQLSGLRTRPSMQQQRDLQSHPLRSVELLSQSGITDTDWLRAVARHHEMEDGSGYPSGCTDVGDLASLARRADVYTAKLAARSHREAMSADLAGRQMFMEDPGHPMTAALVKEFGIYPPGCYVRLASGAVGVVVERGSMVTTPIVACLTGPDQRTLSQPLRVDTSVCQNAVVGICGERSIDARVTAERLLELALR